MLTSKFFERGYSNNFIENEIGKTIVTTCFIAKITKLFPLQAVNKRNQNM